MRWRLAENVSSEAIPRSSRDGDGEGDGAAGSGMLGAGARGRGGGAGGAACANRWLAEPVPAELRLAEAASIVRIRRRWRSRGLVRRTVRAACATSRSSVRAGLRERRREIVEPAQAQEVDARGRPILRANELRDVALAEAFRGRLERLQRASHVTLDAR